MDVGTVKKHIKNKTLEKLYIFTGPEVKVQDIYINKICEVSNKRLERLDTVSDIFKNKKSLLNISKCYVCRDDKDFIKTEKAWDNIIDCLDSNMLIFLLTEVDKRTKFYKRFENNIVTFELLNDDLLYKYTKRELPKLSKTNINKLIHICENDYSKILFESDKIRTFSSYTNEDINTCFETLINEGTIYIPPQDATFDYVDAVLRCNRDLAFELLSECKRIGEPSLRLITVLYNNVRKVLQVQSCTSNNIQECTGLNYLDVKFAKAKIGYWRNGELVYMLQLLRKLEYGIKVGSIEESYAIDYFMIDMF